MRDEIEVKDYFQEWAILKKKGLTWARRLVLLQRLIKRVHLVGVDNLLVGIPLLRQPPAVWWGQEEDLDLLKGIYRHGYNQLEKIRSDPSLCFHHRLDPYVAKVRNKKDNAANAVNANANIINDKDISITSKDGVSMLAPSTAAIATDDTTKDDTISDTRNGNDANMTSAAVHESSSQAVVPLVTPKDEHQTHLQPLQSIDVAPASATPAPLPASSLRPLLADDNVNSIIVKDEVIDNETTTGDTPTIAASTPTPTAGTAAGSMTEASSSSSSSSSLGAGNTNSADTGTVLTSIDTDTCTDNSGTSSSSSSRGRAVWPAPTLLAGRFKRLVDWMTKKHDKKRRTPAKFVAIKSALTSAQASTGTTATGGGGSGGINGPNGESPAPHSSPEKEATKRKRPLLSAIASTATTSSSSGSVSTSGGGDYETKAAKKRQRSTTLTNNESVATTATAIPTSTTSLLSTLNDLDPSSNDTTFNDEHKNMDTSGISSGSGSVSGGVINKARKGRSTGGWTKREKLTFSKLLMQYGQPNEWTTFKEWLTQKSDEQIAEYGNALIVHILHVSATNGGRPPPSNYDEETQARFMFPHAILLHLSLLSMWRPPAYCFH
jgi:hypothetical protein